jgi:hypothetical protein
MRFDEYRGFEVSGWTLLGYMGNFKSFSLLTSKYLAQEGFDRRDADGVAHIDPLGWYSMPVVLRAYHRAGVEAGDRVLRQIGSQIASLAEVPSETIDVGSMVSMINTAYHINHRKEGQMMFDVNTGSLADGVGGYSLYRINAHTFEIECRVPYPCACDLGIFEGGLRRFGGIAQVTHLDDRPCRKYDGESCTLEVRIMKL